jgi:hypothetical protein
MPIDITRLQTTQWLLERQVAWIAAADAKVAVVVALDAAIVAALATAFAAAKSPVAWAVALSLMASVLIIVAIGCAAVSLLPRTSGPQSSLLYFGTVACIQGPDYVAALERATNDELQRDWATQVHRNAEIAARKHLWVRRSVAWSFLAALPWSFAIALLVKP